ncbi:L,D-transpeptidase family protein [Altererythrobacter sp. CAU 1778]
MRLLLAVAPIALLAACGLKGTDNETEADASSSQSTQSDNLADSMASNDEDGTSQIPDSEERPIMQLQVVLDRRGFGPGVIDGEMGISTENALEAFQEANDLDVTGKHDEATKQALAEWEKIPATRVVTIPAAWGNAEYSAIPDDAAEQAEMEKLGYETLDERLAERFHTTVDVLKKLNPGGRPAGSSGGAESTGSTSTSPDAEADDSSSAKDEATVSVFRAGQQIRVPNIGGDRIAKGSVDDTDWQSTLMALGVGSDQPDVARIVVDESDGWLRGYDANDKLIAAFTVTTGSTNDPLPIGNWGINGVGHNPTFAYNPELFWDVPDSEEKQQLPPGPNGPVGVVWIDLTKEHYGIHGTPEPQTIGRTQSHGCVRLTNWDAARLAEMVSTSTKVVFQS